MTNKEMNPYASRRDWCTRLAAMLGAGAISSIPGRAETSLGSAHDIVILNFALRLENLESAFYQQGLGMFAPADFQNSATVQTIGGKKIGANLYSYISQIAQIEQSHVAMLIQFLYELDGTPQAPDCYNFGITTAYSFLQTAQTIENTVVMGYAGVVVPQFETSNATVTSFVMQSMVATIASVEARHAAYFNHAQPGESISHSAGQHADHASDSVGDQSVPDSRLQRSSDTPYPGSGRPGEGVHHHDQSKHGATDREPVDQRHRPAAHLSLAAGRQRSEEQTAQ